MRARTIRWLRVSCCGTRVAPVADAERFARTNIWRATMSLSKICSIAIVSLLFAACAVDQEPTETSIEHEIALDVTADPACNVGAEVLPDPSEADAAAVPDDVALGELAELGVHTMNAGGHYCVDQSSAAAQRISCEVFACWNNPSWNTRLSRNHPVTYHSCVGSTYVNVHSLWTGSCYTMRRDALRPC